MQFLDISTKFLFGKSMGGLDPDTPFDSDQFLAALDRALSGVGQRRLAGRLKPIRLAFDKA